jgi:lipid-A-disaccharide synthase
VQRWPVKPRIITDTNEKHAAMRRARGAIVASGTATLELALAGVPMVVTYRVSIIEEFVARIMIRVPNIALPNLIVGRTIVPELLQRHCTAAGIAAGLLPLLADSAERDAQLTAFDELASLMSTDCRGSPSEYAAELIRRAVVSRARQMRHGVSD